MERKIWSSGDYSDIARLIESAAQHLVTAADVQPGRDVLDVATGSGKWEALRAELEALYHRENMNSDGSFRVEPEYLVTIAHLRGVSGRPPGLTGS